jgi:cobalt/nickel transport system permease protein
MFDEPTTRPSCLTRTDPRVRMALALAASLALAPLKAPCACVACFALSLALLALARPCLKALGARLLGVNVFVAFLAAMLPLSVPGEPAATLLSVDFSKQGFAMAGLIALKANAFVAFFTALVASMDAPTAAYAMERLRMPSKLVFIFIFTLRFIHDIAEEWKRLTTAARLRGFVPKSTRHGYRTLGALLGLLILHSIQRAQRVHEAMLLRGFAGTFRSVAKFRAGWRDAVLAGFVLAGIALVAGIEVLWRQHPGLDAASLAAQAQDCARELGLRLAARLGL